MILTLLHWKRERQEDLASLTLFCLYYQSLVETWHTIPEATVTNSIFFFFF